MKACLLFPNGKEKALTLSYDDGVDTDIQFLELLEKYNIKCTFNISSGRFGAEGSVRAEDQVHFRLCESDVRKVYDNHFCEVATHSYTHPILASLSATECMSEIINDKQSLEKLFDKTICGHAYPYGAYNDNVVDILKQAGIVYARTTESHLSFKIPTDWLRMGATCHHNNSKLSELADKFINGAVGESDGWLFYLWGHTYEFRQNDNWNVIIDFFEKVAKNENVWYATNIEVYEYVTAYRNLVYLSDETKVYNPSSTDVWVKINGNKVFVPAGKTVNFNQ